MKKIKSKTTLLIMSLLVASCATNKVLIKGSHVLLNPSETQIAKSTKNPLSSEKVVVFYKKNPNFKFKEVGIVEVVASGWNSGLKDLMPELKKQAAMMGATAIYKIQIQRHNLDSDTMHATAIAIGAK